MRVCAVEPLYACPRYYAPYCIVCTTLSWKHVRLPADNVRYFNVLTSCANSMRCPHALERHIDHTCLGCAVALRFIRLAQKTVPQGVSMESKSMSPQIESRVRCRTWSVDRLCPVPMDGNLYHMQQVRSNEQTECRHTEQRIALPVLFVLHYKLHLLR
ncbi:hypothetical protein AUEXF2481DRAFT_288532 [Aureobasidium subglaciale EXF-2481]|uniref:Uncharacterized protein n=1 Tax=Aureobasidium subglaciale (strain EXF-2481) TaxID=1043005 RepID=A0A074Y8F0_AURSE|nr:uncharacterized protein AUEXF2481DRAFT_288532 [Aureobasidium subglaciale EXF-2481]KEQ94010.1 hypothetical protein AUEXF2481DRAFT_288532 [Aureobasidium subglaciale EXF-2481]